MSGRVSLHWASKPFSAPAPHWDGMYGIALGGQRKGGGHGKYEYSLFILIPWSLRFAVLSILFSLLSDFVQSADRLSDLLHCTGVPGPTGPVEQFSVLLFYKCPVVHMAKEI